MDHASRQQNSETHQHTWRSFTASVFDRLAGESWEVRLELRVHLAGVQVAGGRPADVGHDDLVDELRDRLERGELRGLEWPQLDTGRKLIVVTAHRRESFGEGFTSLCSAIADLVESRPEVLFVYPAHLNPNVQEPVHRLLADIPNLTLLPPLDYLPMVHLMKHATLVLTDSGGIQEETTALGIPCLTLRDNTERPVTEIGLSPRAADALSKASLTTVGQVIERSWVVEQGQVNEQAPTTGTGTPAPTRAPPPRP